MHDDDAKLDASLRTRWAERFPEIPTVGQLLVSRYADPARVYHDLRHLRDVLHHVDELAHEASDVDAVELAAWFHDAVYDVRGRDNEQDSAALARELLALHLAPERLDEVARLVLLTRDHAVADEDVDGAILCDADLAVLAGAPGEYAGYVGRVRREYGHVPAAAFRGGRADVLRQLLDLPRLFHTSYGRQHWEAPARANLTAELATLI